MGAPEAAGRLAILVVNAAAPDAARVEWGPQSRAGHASEGPAPVPRRVHHLVVAPPAERPPVGINVHHEA